MLPPQLKDPSGPINSDTQGDTITMQGLILILESRDAPADELEAALLDRGAEVSRAGTPARLLKLIDERSPDLLVLDLDAMDMAVLRKIRECTTGCPLVLTAANRSSSDASEAIRESAQDTSVFFLPRGASPAELDVVLEQTTETGRLRREVEHYRRDATRNYKLPADRALIGESPGIQKIRETIDEIALAGGRACPPVLVIGETGTGKGLVAHLIHERSARSKKAFIDINCTTLPETLVEAELFGFEAGSFTDARSAKPGLIETADGGTLFLDEIGEIPLAVQAKLLKVLEEREVRRVGSVKPRRVDLQLITATNRDLRDAVNEKTFRSDLYYRLNVLKIRLPPLRERGDDILQLAEFFVELHARNYHKRDLKVSDSYRRALKSYNWPGNVRELSNVIERSVIVARSGDTIEMPGFDTERGGVKLQVNEAGGVDDIQIPTKGIDLEEVERALLQKALEMTGGNVAQAARRLGITRERMRYRIEKHGLSADKKGDED